MPPPNPYAGKWVTDMWGNSPRNDWVYGDDAMATGNRWRISGESGAQGNYQLFDSAEAAQAWIDANRRAGPSQSQQAYSASLRQQGIPESELPYGSGQMRTFLAQAGRGLPVSSYLRQWAQQTPGAWGRLGQRMYDERPPALSGILAGKDDPETWTEDRRRQALIEFLMRTYGAQGGGSTQAQ